MSIYDDMGKTELTRLLLDELDQIEALEIKKKAVVDEFKQMLDEHDHAVKLIRKAVKEIDNPQLRLPLKKEGTGGAP